MYFRRPSSGVFGGLLGYPVRYLLYCFSLLFYFLWKLNLSIGTYRCLKCRMRWFGVAFGVRWRQEQILTEMTVLLRHLMILWCILFVVAFFIWSILFILLDVYSNHVSICTNLDMKPLCEIMRHQEWECFYFNGLFLL